MLKDILLFITRKTFLVIGLLLALILGWQTILLILGFFAGAWDCISNLFPTWRHILVWDWKPTVADKLVTHGVIAAIPFVLFAGFVANALIFESKDRNAASRAISTVLALLIIFGVPCVLTYMALPLYFWLYFKEWIAGLSYTISYWDVFYTYPMLIISNFYKGFGAIMTFILLFFMVLVITAKAVFGNAHQHHHRF